MQHGDHADKSGVGKLYDWSCVLGGRVWLFCVRRVGWNSEISEEVIAEGDV